MEEYYIDKDIKVFYVTATSFPEGVGGAFQKNCFHSFPNPTKGYYMRSVPPMKKG